jgi:tetratricopeptide (TPR) repeat protein
MAEDKPRPAAAAQPQPAAAGPRRAFEPRIWCAAAAALLGLALYANTIGHGYVFDDEAVVAGNPDVRAGLAGIPNIWRAGIWRFQNVNLGYYRPLSLITFAVENQFWPGNPRASHVGNVLLYAATGFFLCLLLMRIFRYCHPAFPLLVTALFLAHPIHTEVVANIKSRDELLAFLNLVIALLLFLRCYGPDRGRRAWNRRLILPALLFFYLALLSKETALAGLLIAPLALYFASDEGAARCLLRTLPWLAVALVFQFQKHEMLGTLSGAVPNDIANYPYAAAGAGLPSTFLVLSWCLRLMLLPHPLTCDYSYNQIPAGHFSSPAVLLGVLIAAALAYFSFKGLAAKSPRALGALLFSVTLAPALAFVLIRGGILAERFLYAPALGFSIVVLLLLAAWARVPLRSPEADWRSFWGAPRFIVPVAVICALYALKTVSRNTVWRDNLTLFSHDVTASPGSCQAHRHYGAELINASIAEKDPRRKLEWFEQGTSQLKAALAIDPHLSAVWFKLGVAYQWVRADYAAAISCYSRAIQEEPQTPGSAGAYNNLGAIYDRLNKQELASYCFNKAVAVNPYFRDAVINHQRHVKRTGLDVRELRAAARFEPRGSPAAARDEQAMSRILWGF